jgi:nitronate monooxygenase
MSRVAGPELVAAVSAAGGLGILAALRLEPDDLRAQIRRIRELTSAPFGVNLWLHPGVVVPLAPESIDARVLDGARSRLNEIRTHIGLSRSSATPSRFPELVARNFDVVVDERVPVWSIGLGNPDTEMVKRCHERGIHVMAMATNVADARALAARDVDVVVAQGVEAGGHRSNWTADPGNEAATMVVVPQIVDAVNKPVLAAGGIVDGRGLMAALALGAAGVMLGTRFIARRESIAPAFSRTPSCAPARAIPSSAPHSPGCRCV